MSNKPMNTAKGVLDKHFPNYIYPVTNNERKLILAAMEEYRNLPTPAIEPSPSIEQMAEALRAYVRAQGRMLDRWSEGDDKVKSHLWKELHACEDAARSALSCLSSRTLPQADKVATPPEGKGFRQCSAHGYIDLKEQGEFIASLPPQPKTHQGEQG